MLILLVSGSTISAQLSGTKSIPVDYPTIAAAVTALNSAGVGTGGVTFNIAANYTETISTTISITATGTSANPVIFQKDPATSGSNPLITAYTGGVGTPGTAIQDGILRFIGSDYITIDGIDVSDNPANTSNPSTMEYGFSLYKASTSNGCQNITIKNCVITLNNSNNATATLPMVDGSTGIIVMNSLATTATTVLTPIAGGTNSNNKFYSNTIQNCNNGIALIGYAAASPFTLADTDNDVGGSSSGTGNTIINYGGASGALNAAVGIRTLAQYGINISYNTINNNNGAGTNHPATLEGIYMNTALSASATVTNNLITVKGGGTTQHIYGIENTAGSTAAGNTINISNNTVTNCTYTTATTGGFYGIHNTATPATINMCNNTVSNNFSAATTTGFLYGILNTGAATNVTMSSNTVSGNSTAGLTTGLFVGVYNSGSAGNVTINTNTIVGNSTTSLSGAYYAIYNTGAVTTALTINSNNIGNGTTGAFTFNAANSGAQIFINSTLVAATAALSISNNNFQGITYAVQGTGSNTYISNTAATKSQAINNNTFTNLNVNTTGNVTFIANSVIVSSTGTQDVNNNSIVTAFNKAGAGGTVTLFTSVASSLTGSIINNNNNNFSNINVTGATIIAGWINTDAGASTKTIQNNTFTNWTGGTGAITAMSINVTGSNNATTGNTINNISSAGVITGIATAAGNDNIYSNNINTLVSTGTLLTTVNGISITAGTTKNIYQNTIYNLQGNSITTGTVRGIVISAGTTINTYQNTIYSLQGNLVTTGSVNGISISGGTTINANQNIIYSLQANSLTTGTVNGISVSGGTTSILYRNKIYDLSSSSSIITGFVNGIQVSGATANSTTTIRHNLIGDLRAPSASSTDPIRGISLISTGLTSTINVYNNTVYLTATSSGTNFGSTGIYHTTSTTATTATLDLRNNIILNASVPNGTGLTVAYRRSSSTLTNYGSTSNNNLFYVGLAAASRLIFYDGTNSDQLLSTYKPRVSPRDAQSVTEDMITASKFISISGASASFLHLDPTKATQVESGGISIAGVTTDFDGQTIQGNAGYTGTGTTPDIGADEIEGIRISTLSGTYNVGAGQTFTSLTNADGLFANINSRGLSGNVVVNITSDLAEDGTNVLYQWAEQGIGNYTLTIKPDASTGRIISGNILAGMIRLNGAKRVIIDGSNGTTSNYLTFRNTNTAGTTGTAFTFINGATNNTIKYCTIEAYANATNGVILFSTSTIAGGNSNNTIINCSVNATVSSNIGNTCIYSAGTVGKENSTNTVSNNKIYNYRDRGLDISATGSTTWSISGNSFYNGDVTGSINYASASTLHGIRILGGAGYLISNNYLGGNAASAGGTAASYTSTLGNVSFQGIMLTTSAASPASTIKGNTIANIAVSSVPTVAGSIAFSGIETSGSGITIGGALTGDGNIIGSNTVNGSISITTTTGTSTFTTTIRGINCGSTGGAITGNQVGGIDIKNIGTAPAASTFIGIYASNATAPSQVNNNIVGIAAVTNSIRVLSTSTAIATSLTGILIGTSVTSTVLVDGNTVQNMSNLTIVNTTGPIAGIQSGAATATANITISNNTVSSLLATAFSVGTGSPTSSYFVGINNTGAAGTVRINSNTIKGLSTNSTAGNFNAIRNTGAVITTIQIDNNQIGNSTTPAITFNVANSGSQIFINNTGGGASAALSISTNNFQGVTYSAAGSSANTYILNSAATLSQAINGNTFTNLNINTTGSITFISNSVIVPATGTQNVNGNSIAGTFTKAGAGAVTLFTSTVNSVAGSIINNNSNNFSHITVTGTATIAGWVNTDAGTPTKMIQNNTFSYWIGGTGAITVMSVNLTGANNSITGNAINNISSAAAITGITTGAGNDNIYSNIINTFSTTGASAVTGISITGGTVKNVYKNKIYDLQANNATGTVNGILVSGTTIVTINIYNNLIGDLRTPIENSATDAIRGISVTATALNSTINVYYNTIYLNASSTGTTFSSTGIYHTTSTTATTATLNLRNNNITNTSTPKGAGITATYRRSDATLTNYASASNNNLFYAGTPGASKLIFYGVTISDQTIAAFKTRVATRDSLSVTENLTAKFLSTTGSSSLFLHMDNTQPTLLESGAANISGFTDDFDAQVRAGNTGYTGAGTSPDIGADEIFGIEVVPPTITYTALTDTTSTTNRNITAISITDASGINNNAGTKPRIYYKRFSDANVWLDNTSATNGWKYTEATNTTSPYTFTIDYSQLYGGSSVTAGVIQYFIVAQDLSTVANVAINSGTFNTSPASGALTAATFPIGGTINSYKIPFSGNYNIGTGEVFTSLTKAGGLFEAINSAGLMGNTTFSITSDITEDGTNALNQWAESGAGNYTVIIQPDAPTLRTISGNVVAGLIRFNGADRVTIDGRNSGSGSYLSFKNTNTAGTTGTAFTFINGATNNTIQYCDAEAYSNATNGVILFSTSATAGGNSNNLIDNCTINTTVGPNTGNVAIYSAGTVGNENSGNTISNSTIFNYRDRAIDITASGSTGWTISNNNLYNGDVTGAINYAAATALHGIRIAGGTGYSILNNYIGGNTIQASGTNAAYSSTSGNLSYQGILLTTSGATPVSFIQGNTIASISVSSVPTAANSTAFTGIETNGSGITIGGTITGEGNTIGSNISNGSITITTSTTATTNTSLITGINCASSNGLIIGNQVGGIDINNIGSTAASSSFTGLSINSATAPSSVNNNIIGSSITANSIRVLSTSSATTTSLSGISIGSAVNSDMLLNENVIKNLSQLSLTSSGSFTGISNSASSGVLTISNDTIQNILTAANANAGSTVYTGISSSAATLINNNIINNIVLSSTGTNAQIIGINISGAFANTISGNIISGLSTTSNKSTANVETGSPAGSAIIGVLNSTTVAGQIINNNRFAGFTATSAANVNVVVTGIGITSTGSGSIFNNRFGTMTNLATGAAPAICHIIAASGSFNVYNNTLRISNLLNTNSVKIYGIVHASATSWNYYHNTVRVGGSTNGAALRSAAFLLSGNSSPVLNNNIFFNIRTGSGTGYNYSVSNLGSPPSNWSASASDYNDFYSINSNTIAEWGDNISKTFAQWQSLTGGDAHSISNAISFITSTYDLEPDSITNCNFNNAGTPITIPVVINTDINNKPRNTTNPDMGAYEFNYTGFSIIAGSNSPVCAGDSLLLTVNPGNALIPSYSWRNPANVVISTSRNPTVPLTAGQYKITVSDSTGCYVTDSTLVTINQRPTATITSQTSLCDSGYVNLNISITGTGLISGTLSNGDNFSGRAPLIVVPVLVTATTSFSISDLSDSICTAIPADIPDTVTVTVTHKGDWLGITSNWNDPINWCEGIVPTSSTDVVIPTGTLIMPLITGSANCNNLTINTGDTLTITGPGTLNIAGIPINYGVYKDNGTTNFNGTSGQQTFSGVSVFNNLTLNNSSGLLLPGSIVINNNLTISTGTLNANNFNITIKGNWTNNSSITAFTAGTATVTFSGTTAQTIGGTFITTFTNLTIANTASTVTLNVNASISGNLSVSSGIFDLAGFTANRVSAGGTLSVSNNATMKIGGTNTYPINYATNTLVLASTVEYSGTNQTIANQSYGNLTLSSSSGSVIKTFPNTSLTITGNLSSLLGTGTSLVFTAASDIVVHGNVFIDASTTFNGSSYSHSIGGNWVNNGTFNGNSSMITFIHPGATVSGTGAQNFNNLTIAASGISFTASIINLSGNLAISGPGSFTQASGGTLEMSGTGKTISGSGISLDNLTISGTVTTSALLGLTGNLSVSGSFTASSGTITMRGTSKTISGAGSMNFAVLSVTGSVTTNTNFSILSALVINGSFSASAGTVTFTGSSSLSGTANLFNIEINGTQLQLGANSELGIANTLTITSGILNVASFPNTVNFNGTAAQSINGITYNNLILSNGNTKTAAGDIDVENDITINAGTTFDPSSYTHSVDHDWFNNGTFTPGTSTIQFTGDANSDISGKTTFNILTLNGPTPSVELFLFSHVSAAIVNVINGTIVTGSDTLTITNTRTGNSKILGNIQRTHAFTTGIAYAFEGPNNTITFSSVSSVTDIIISVSEDRISDFPFGGSTNEQYQISVPTGTYNATLRLDYEDAELNGNNEVTMGLWHYNDTSWVPVGKTDNSVASHWVEQSGLTDITNRWTLSDEANVIQWNGSVSTDWNTAANWTALQGSPSSTPSASDIVDLGTGSFTYQPTISSSVSIKSLHFGSAKAIALTLGSGGSLTVLGNLDGDWDTAAIHTINVDDQTLTVNGNINLSDGTNGEAIDLNIGSGTVTTLVSLIESGGANINFSGAGTLNVYLDFYHTSGTFNPGSGTVVYNGVENQDIGHVPYNNLTINKSAGIATIDSITNIAGNLLLTAGELENSSLTTISGNVILDSGSIVQDNDSIYVGGNWTNNGTYEPTGSGVFFNGSGAQNISASAFGNLTINKPSGTALLTGEVTMTGDLDILSGTLDFQNYSINRNVTGGVDHIANGAVAILSGSNGPLGFSTYIVDTASTVIFNGTDPQFFLFDGISLGNLICRNGPKTLLSSVQINGSLTIDSGATLDASSYTIALKGNWINHGTFIPGTSTVLLTGASKNISGNTTFNQFTVTGSYTLLNDAAFNNLLTITNTGSLSCGPTIHTTLNGDLINSGVLYSLGTTIFTGNVLQTLSLINPVTTVALIVVFNGTVSPVLNSTSAPQFGYIVINNTGGVNPSVGWNILYSMTVGPGASFNGGNSTHNILGAVTNYGTITSTGTFNFIPSSAATVNLGSNFSSTGTVNFGGAGAMTLAGTPASLHDVLISNTNGSGITPSSDWNITNNLTVNSSSIFNAGNRSYLVGGNISNRGTVNSGTSIFTLDGASTQNISTASPFNNLTINKATGSATLSSNVTVNGLLNFVAGNIQTGSNLLIQPSSGTITGAAQNTGWVNGKYQKNIATGATSKTFEIGDAASYTPVSIAFSNVTTAGNLIASTTTGDHPNISNSTISTDKSVNRFWTLTNSGVVFTDCAATFNFVTTDIDAGASTSSFDVELYNGSSWDTLVTASPNATNIQATGITTFGDFAVGEICYKGTSISYPASPYCSNAGTVSATRTGASGGIYSSTSGLSINAATGAINLATSTPGSYTIAYTIGATGGCRSYVTSANIIISGAPSATISYAGSPYCSNAGTAPITFSGTPGGTYSSTTGLSINGTTGDITLASSTAGTYTITYTITGANGCGQFTTTTSVTITPLPSAIISYSGNPYCSSAGTVTVTRTGTAGGVYSSTAGLSINAATGSITTGTSTEGTYTVTYTVAAANGCGQFTTTTSVTITPLPSATISYSGSPFCNLPGTVPVIFAGTEGGTFSSTTGLSIDATSGDINTGTSTAGTYTITYTVDPAEGCGQYTTTTSITIVAPGIWTGAVSNDWHTAGNWLCGAIPTATTNVMIPGSLTNYPLLNSGIGAVQNITIQSSASLTITDVTLQIAGSITNSGTFDVSEGDIEMNGSSAQTIPASAFFGNTVENLTINNTAGVTLGGPLSLIDVLTISNGSLAADGYLTLKSTATTTARVAPITSTAATPISGNVIIERYIPGRRKYRLITSPVTTSESSTLIAGQENLSIWGNWQNGGINTTPNVGSLITGGSAADGFDIQTPNASLFTYDDVNRKFTGYTTANGKNTKYTPLKAGVAYFMFVYGDRLNSVVATNPHNTVLVSTGTLKTGDQVYNTSSAIPLSGVTGRFTLLGNPFASPIDWSTISKTNLDNTYWGWDPNLSSTGGYITVTTAGSITLQAPYSGNTGLNQYIQPGQGFFVKTSGSSPVLTIREQDKASNFNANAFRTSGTANDISLLAINLKYVSGSNNVLADGVLAAFDPAFSNQAGAEDATKMANTAESMAISIDTTSLSIDARPMPEDKDTLFLNVSGLTKPQYTLQIFGQDMETSGIQPYLQDRYLNTLQLLSMSDTNNIVFNVNAGIPASADINRFRIVFRSFVVLLPVTYTSIKATQKNRDIEVDWEVAEESGIQKYEIEKSADGIRFDKAGEVTAIGNNSTESYHWLDIHPVTGNNYYRVRAIQEDGKHFVSKTVVVKISAAKAAIKVFPNPVKNQQLNIRSDELEKGKYIILIHNPQGQQIIYRVIDHPGGPLNQIIYFSKTLPAGMYYLQVTGEKEKYSQSVFLE
jgi:hypothetical protein